jgi:hypothetical protein
MFGVHFLVLVALNVARSAVHSLSPLHLVDVLPYVRRKEDCHRFSESAPPATITPACRSDREHQRLLEWHPTNPPSTNTGPGLKFGDSCHLSSVFGGSHRL